MKRSQLSRQTFLGTSSYDILTAAKIGIVGLGGGGSHIVQQLAHIAVGNFELFDPDRFEDTNLNRLVGATFGDIKERTLKTVIADRVIHAVNPDAQVKQHSEDWRRCAEHLRSCDVVFGCVDSFVTRSEIEVVCRRYHIPYIDIGMDVFELPGGHSISGQIILSMPGERCMRCLGFLQEHLITKEASKYGAAGPRPQVIWPNGILASTAVGLFMSLILPWRKQPIDSVYLEYDGDSHTVTPSSFAEALGPTVCHHFKGFNDLGDPFFSG